MWTRFRCRLDEKRYDVFSSLKELGRAVVIARTLSSGSRIIPGDWGMVGPGWLARPLSSRSASSGSGGRIHQFLWHVRACQLRETRNLAIRNDQKPFRVGSSSSGRFRAWVNRSYPEGNRLLLCISTGCTTLADSIKPFETAQ